jgi:putative NADH-flavin reductase
MKIAVYGGTGNIGSQIVAEAVRRGHDVTALARREQPVADGATFAIGDADDASTAPAVAAAHDVVVSALGPTRDPAGDPNTFVDVIRSLTDSIGSTRLLVVGGASSLFAAPGVRLLDTPEFPEIYKPEARAGVAAFDFLREDARPDLDWTYLSPAPEIGPGERTGKYVLGLDEPAGKHITFADYAVALVDEIETPQHRRRRFTVAN